MKKFGLSHLPTSILALAAGFFVFPIWSLSFFNPFEVYLRTGSWIQVLSYLVAYWILPSIIVVLALRRSLYVLPIFLIECGALFVQTMVSPISATPYMQLTRFVLLIALLGVGFLLLSREMIFPLLSKNGRRWRINSRFALNYRAQIESVVGSNVQAKAMIENASRTGLLVSASANDFETLLAKLKPNAPISLTIKAGASTIQIPGRIVWFEASGPVVRFGIESIESVPVEALVKRSRTKNTKFFPKLIEELRMRFYTGSRVFAISAWSVVIGGTLAIPNCGTEEDSGVARVGDAPHEGVAEANLSWDRDEFQDAFQLADSSVFHIVSIIDRCKSEYSARIEWNESTKTKLPLVIGDVDCRLRIQEIRLGSEIFVFTGVTYNYKQNAINKYASAKGNGLSVVSKKILPKVIGKTIDVQYGIAAKEVTPPITIKVELPQNACTVEIAEGGNPFDKKVEFKIRVHPAYLPYASALTFFPCGESQQWSQCRPSEIKKVVFLNKVTKQNEKEKAPYMVSAVLDIKNPSVRSQALNEGKSLSCREYFYLPR